MSTTTIYSLLIAEYASILDALEIEVESYIEFSDGIVSFSLGDAEVSVYLGVDDYYPPDGCYDLVLIPSNKNALVEKVDDYICVYFKAYDQCVSEYQDDDELLAFVAFVSRIASKIYSQGEMPEAFIYLKDGTLGITFYDFGIEVSIRNEETKKRKDFETEVEFFELNGVITFNL